MRGYTALIVGFVFCGLAAVVGHLVERLTGMALKERKGGK